MAEHVQSNINNTLTAHRNKKSKRRRTLSATSEKEDPEYLAIKKEFDARITYL